MWIRSLSLKTGDPAGHAARAWHYPNVLSVRKRDLGCAYSWGAQQAGAATGRLGVRRDEDMSGGKPGTQETNSQNNDGQNQSPAVEPRLQGAMRHFGFPPDRADGFACFF
jgi:hypothetical protein